MVQLASYLQDPLRYLQRARERFGSVFTVRWPGMPAAVYFTDNDSIESLFRSDPDVLCAGRSNRVLDFVTGPRSVARLDGVSHRARRRLLATALGRAGAHVPTMAANTVDALRQCVGRGISFRDFSQVLTLRNLIQCAIGIEDPERAARLHALMVDFMRRSLDPVMAVLWVSLPGDRLRKAMVRYLPALADRGLGRAVPFARLAKTVRDLDTLLYTEIAERRGREEAGGHGDVLGTMMAHDDAGALSDEDLRDEAMAMLVAGHETTSTTMDWVIVEALQRPEVLARMRAEVDAVVGDATVSASMLPRLPYLSAVVEECLRLHPPVPGVGRWVRRDTMVGEVPVPAGSMASASILLANRCGRRWASPEVFRPERFVDQPRSGCPVSTSFGGGARLCPGRGFALVQLQCVIATIVSRFDLVPERWPPTHLAQRGLFTGVSHPIDVAVHERRPSTSRHCDQAGEH